MGCFSACFGRSSNGQSKTEKANGTKVLDPKTEPTTKAQNADPLEIDTEIEDKNEEQLNSCARKKVTIDSNVKIPEEDCKTQSRECENPLVENEKGRECGTRKKELRAFLFSSEKEEEKTEGEQGKNQSKFLSDSSEKEKRHKEKTNGKQGKDQAADVLSDSSQSSLFTYPPNDRYKNCATSDDECEGTAINESNLADEVASNYKDKDGPAGPMIQEESSESLFSLSIDSRRQTSTPEIGDKEVSSPFKPCNRAMISQSARDRTQPVYSVLNPIENLGQWKPVRTKTTSSLKSQEKENANNSEEFTMAFVGNENLNSPFSEGPTLKQSKRISNFNKDDVIAVDTSLSSWLIESEKTPTKENSLGSVGNSSSKRMKSPKSFEDRPILGALTLDELKQMSRYSSPRPSPSFSPDETPIIGTVGSYWRHTGQAADADSGFSCKRTASESSRSGRCRKDKMNNHSTPFQTRLEQAMDSVAAEV